MTVLFPLYAKKTKKHPVTKISQKWPPILLYFGSQSLDLDPRIYHMYADARGNQINRLDNAWKVEINLHQASCTESYIFKHMSLYSAFIAYNTYSSMEVHHFHLDSHCLSHRKIFSLCICHYDIETHHHHMSKVLFKKYSSLINLKRGKMLYIIKMLTTQNVFFNLKRGKILHIIKMFTIQKENFND